MTNTLLKNCPNCDGTGHGVRDGSMQLYGCMECEGYGEVEVGDYDHVTVEPYFNPTLPGNWGMHAYDDNGNHGHGRGTAEALNDYQRKLDAAQSEQNAEAA